MWSGCLTTSNKIDYVQGGWEKVSRADLWNFEAFMIKKDWKLNQKGKDIRPSGKAIHMKEFGPYLKTGEETLLVLMRFANLKIILTATWKVIMV